MGRGFPRPLAQVWDLAPGVLMPGSCIGPTEFLLSRVGGADGGGRGKREPVSQKGSKPWCTYWEVCPGSLAPCWHALKQGSWVPWEVGVCWSWCHPQWAGVDPSSLPPLLPPASGGIPGVNRGRRQVPGCWSLNRDELHPMTCRGLRPQQGYQDPQRGVHGPL